MTTHDAQFTQKVRLGSGGRVVIPAEVRSRMGWKPDEALRIRIVDGEVRLESISDGVRRAQSLFRKFYKGEGSLVDELIADRRAEAAREEEEARRDAIRFRGRDAT